MKRTALVRLLSIPATAVLVVAGGCGDDDDATGHVAGDAVRLENVREAQAAIHAEMLAAADLAQGTHQGTHSGRVTVDTAQVPALDLEGGLVAARSVRLEFDDYSELGLVTLDGWANHYALPPGTAVYAKHYRGNLALGGPYSSGVSLSIDVLSDGSVRGSVDVDGGELMSMASGRGMELVPENVLRSVSTALAPRQLADFHTELRRQLMHGIDSGPDVYGSVHGGTMHVNLVDEPGSIDSTHRVTFMDYALVPNLKVAGSLVYGEDGMGRYQYRGDVDVAGYLEGLVRLDVEGQDHAGFRGTARLGSRAPAWIIQAE